MRWVAEVGDPGTRLVVAAHGDVAAAPQWNDVVIVDRAVLRGGLRPRQRPLAELRARGGVVEEHAFLHRGIAFFALWETAAAGLPAEHEHLPVPRKGGRVPAAVRARRPHVRVEDGVEELGVLDAPARRAVGADVPDVHGVGTRAGGQVDSTSDHGSVVAARADIRRRAGERLAPKEARASGIGDRNRDDVHEVADRVVVHPRAVDAAGAARVLLYTIRLPPETPATVRVCDPQGSVTDASSTGCTGSLMSKTCTPSQPAGTVVPRHVLSTAFFEFHDRTRTFFHTTMSPWSPLHSGWASSTGLSGSEMSMTR